MLAARDRPGAVSRALAAVDTGEIDIPTLYSDVLTPILVEMGALWQTGRAAVWQEHWVSATVRTIIEALYPRVIAAARGTAKTASGKAPGREVARKVLLACPSEEAHDIGLRILADRFELAGWETTFLGADTPEEEIVAAARAIGADAAVLSAATHFNRLRLRHVADTLAEVLPDVKVRVTGAAFRNDHEGWLDEELLKDSDLLGVE